MNSKNEAQIINTTWSDRTRRIMAFVLIFTAGIILFLARSVLPYLVVAGLMAIIAGPVIAFLQTRLRFPKGLAIIFTYLLMLAMVILLPLLIVSMITSLVQLGSDLTEVIAGFREWLIATLESLRTVEIFGFTVDLSNLIDPMLVVLESLSIVDLMPSPEQIITFITTAFGTTVTVALKGLGLLISVGFAVFITFSYAFYLSADGQRMAAELINQIPPGFEREVTILGRRIHTVWKGYVIGQLAVMVAVGVIVWLVTALLGLPQALALGVIAGALEIIPTLGPILAAIPAVLIALFQGSTRFEINHVIFAIIVVIAYLVIQKIEDTVLTPNIQGRAVELPPLVVVVSVMVGFHVGGLLGAVVAVPVVATIRELYFYAYSKVLKQEPYPE